MVFFSSLIVFIIAFLKSLSAETNIWGHRETVSVDCVFPLSMFTHISQFLLNTGNLRGKFFFFDSNTVFFFPNDCCFCFAWAFGNLLPGLNLSSQSPPWCAATDISA